MNIKSTIVFAVAFLAVATLGAGVMQAPPPTSAFCGSPDLRNLVIDRSSDAGEISVYNNADQLVVQLATEGGWMLAKTDVHVSTSRQSIPQTGAGAPSIGRFDFQRTYDQEAIGDTFKLNLDKWEAGTTLYIAVHSVVVKLGDNHRILRNDTAWAEGASFGDSSAMYFTYTVQACGTQSKPAVDQGCGASYWAAAPDYRTWASYAPNERVMDVFSRGSGEQSLSEALTARGNGLTALTREATAGLLNATSTRVNYRFSETEVLSLYQTAFDSGQYDRALAVLREANSLVCPLK